MYFCKLFYITQSAISRSKLPTKTVEQGVKYVKGNMFHWRRSAVFIFNFEHISHLVLVFLLLTLLTLLLTLLTLLLTSR